MQRQQHLTRDDILDIAGYIVLGTMALSLLATFVLGIVGNVIETYIPGINVQPIFTTATVTFFIFLGSMMIALCGAD